MERQIIIDEVGRGEHIVRQRLGDGLLIGVESGQIAEVLVLEDIDAI